MDISTNDRKKKEQAEQETPSASTTENDEEVEAMVIGGIKINIQRYKGLGEMNPEQLWETTMDPEQRLMKQITAEDAQLANETFEILMGEDVEQRKKFIQTHAKSVQNLDI
jgi:DNA gyrase subunit B